MNIVEAMNRALTGQRIKRKQKNEWMIVSDGKSELRWLNNRQRVHLTVADVIADDWMSEEDMVTVSRIQVEEALSLLQPVRETEKEEFFKHLGFK